MVDGDCAFDFGIEDYEIKIFGPAPLRCRADSFWAIETLSECPFKLDKLWPL